MSDHVYMRFTFECLSTLTACSDKYLVNALKQRGNVAVWNIQSKQKPEILLGHQLMVSALALSNSPESYLCSCSEDIIILWDLSKSDDNPERKHVLSSNVNQNPSACCFNINSSEVFVSSDMQIMIFNLIKGDSVTKTVHSSPATMISICWNQLLAVIDESNYFKVWNLNNSKMLFQTYVSHDPTCMSIETQTQHLAIGTSEGSIFIYARNFALIRTWKARKLLKEYMTCMKNSGLGGEYCDNEYGFCVLTLKLFTSNKEATTKTRYFPASLFLIVVTSSFLLSIEVNTEAVTKFVDLKNDLSTGIVGAASVGSVPSSETAFITLHTVACNAIVLLQLCLRDCLRSEKNKMIGAQIKATDEQDVPTSQPAQTISYLNFKMKNPGLKECSEVQKIYASATSKKPMRVKSSGYGVLNWSVDYDSLCAQKPILLFDTAIDDGGGILSLKLSDDGQFALFGSNRGIVETMKVCDKDLKVLKPISCHSHVVNSVHWSNSGFQWITAGSDKTTKVWKLESYNRDPVLKLPFSCKNTNTNTPKNEMFEDEVAQAQFYYMDQFILLSVKNVLRMYSYSISPKQELIRRFDYVGRSQLVAEVELKCQRITAFTAANQHYSNHVICAGTSKGLDVIDMNTATVVWHVEMVCNKPPFAVILNEHIEEVHQDGCGPDIFITSSFSDGIKVWDRRYHRSVINYHEHCCQTIKCGVALSPSGRYIASGSENQSVYLYDLRMTSSLYKLSDPTDIITGVAFSSSNPHLLASSLGGKVYLYGK